MKLSALLILTMTLSLTALAGTKNKEASICNESVAASVIKYLEKQEPKAELHVVKNEKGQLIGLTDANEIYPDIDFVRTIKLKENVYENVFQFDTVIIFADYWLNAPNGLPSCAVKKIQMAQDDQDRD